MSSQATLEALEPLGSSVAGAIVCAALFFVAGAVSIGYYFYTKYPWYDVIIIACFFRTVAYCCRAAYLGGTYRPALAGTFLAFLNAGYGASCAAICLTLGWWYKNKPVAIFKPRGENWMKWLSIGLSFPIVCFGPIIGVIAAGCIFGAYDDAILGHRGIRLRFVASYGLVACNAANALLLVVSCIGIYRVPPHAPGPKGSQNPSRQNPRLVVLLLICSLLLLIRGCAGVAALYPTKEYVWVNDHYFYPLDTLPELIAFVILCWPCLLARTACCWPKEGSNNDEEKHEKGEIGNGVENGNAAEKEKRSEQPHQNGTSGPQGVVVDYA